MRAIVLALLAAVVGFTTYAFWAGGREAATPPAPFPVTDAAPADPTAGAVDVQAEAMAGPAGKATEAGGAAADRAAMAAGAAAQAAADGADAIRDEIQGLVDAVVEEEEAAPVPAPSD